MCFSPGTSVASGSAPGEHSTGRMRAGALGRVACAERARISTIAPLMPARQDTRGRWGAASPRASRRGANGGASPYGVAPVVVSIRLRPERRAAIRDALLQLHEDPEARAALGLVGFDRFSAPEPKLYAGAAGVRRRSRGRRRLR